MDFRGETIDGLACHSFLARVVIFDLVVIFLFVGGMFPNGLICGALMIFCFFCRDE